MDPSRRALFAKLQSQVFDVLVIGGGITGAGIARDAALRGLKVALVDKNDFGAGTSSKSSKLIHGGLRYLQQAEFGLVFESVSERTRLLKMAPHIVRPLEFLVPAYRGQYPGRIMLACGLMLYDALAKFAVPGRHRSYGKKAILGREPGLRRDKLTGGVTYFDSTTDDARLTLENILDAQRLGAEVVPYACVEGFLSERVGASSQALVPLPAPGEGEGEVATEEPAPPKKKKPGRGKRGAAAKTFSEVIRGVELRDVLNPDLVANLRARITINATGPWSDLVLRLLQRDQPPPLLRPTKGSHIVLDWARLPVRHAVVMTTPQDARVIFAIPWMDEDVPAASRTILGTTDTDYHGDPDRVAADAADVEYLLTCGNHYFPESKLVPDDVLSTWSGLRPLVMPEESGLAESQVSREHRILDRPGLLTIVGGKLTTYRKMAAQVVEAAFTQLGQEAPTCTTEERPLPGAEGLLSADEADPIESVRLALLSLGNPAIDAQVARHLSHKYGARALAVASRIAALPAEDGGQRRLDPELPFLMLEVDIAVEEELAQRIDDVLGRRVPLLLLARDAGLGCLDAVAERMARRLGWDAARKSAELAHYRDIVGLSRSFRTPTARSTGATG
ncbi:MAG TPA: glycerol-3-phosphate dehydrogenase/oxidase [Pseudomonadota bacterium]|nr:glycerol-3-phosphate dehydrogenase/oxidase [Pseudomonadota bacterium]